MAGLIRDLERGSCDLNRATAQAQHFTLTSQALPMVVLLDLRAGTLCSVVKLAEDVRADVPVASWRELPCDGSWIQRLV